MKRNNASNQQLAGNEVNDKVRVLVCMRVMWVEDLWC
jgi:hypothetical protein